MYIFKYHPDNTIYRDGKYLSTFAEFVKYNPNFPITEGDFFEYSDDKFVTINSQGHDVVVNRANYSTVMNKIDNLAPVPVAPLYIEAELEVFVSPTPMKANL